MSEIHRNCVSLNAALADAWAEYAVPTLGETDLVLEFRRVPCAASKLIDVFRESGRPHAEDAIAQH